MKYNKTRDFIKLVLFLIIFICVFIWISFLFRPNHFFKKNLLGYYAEPNNTVDVVFIGGSSTYLFWAPMEAYKNFGMTSYNFAGDAMSPAIIKNSIIEVEKTQTPKLLVIDTRAFVNRENNPNYYTEAYIRYYTDSLNYSNNRIAMINYASNRENIEKDKSLYIDLIKYHSRWKELNVFSFQNSFNRRLDPYKGYCFIYQYAPLNINDYSNVWSIKKLSSDNDRVLTELLDYCRNNSINCLFTVNPYKMEDKESQMYYNYIQKRVNEYGYGFINTNNYYNEIKIDFSNDYYDINHVNIFGAVKYTNFLASYIESNYNLPDWRGDDRYKSWDNKVAIWNESSEYCKSVIQDLKNNLGT